MSFPTLAPSSMSQALHYSRNAFSFLTALAAVILLTGAAAAELRQPPGSRIKMDVPATFEISKLFSGFILPVAGASVVIAELPTNRLDKLKSSLTDEALAKKGIKNVERLKLKRTDDYVYITAKQNVRGGVFNKHVLLIKDDRSVAVITFNIPEDSIINGFVSEEVINKALVSASFADKAAPIIKQFSLGHLGVFKEAGKLMGSAFLYSTDGMLVPKVRGVQRSVVIVAPSVDRMSVTDLKVFSERALRAIGGFNDVKLAETQTVAIGGLNGVRSEATAISSDDKSPVAIVQVILERPKGGHFRLMAIIRKDEQAKLMPEVEKLIASFKPVGS